MSYKNIELDENIILKNKIPLLINEKDWLNIFGKMNDRNISSMKEELVELEEKRKSLENEEEKLKKEKSLAMKMILGISNSVNNENKVHNVDMLDEYKEKIENINERLDTIAYELENIYPEIKELNFNLLRATVYYGYKEIKKQEKELREVTEELDRIRERTRELINEKYDYEEWINSAYSFLHGMLGREETDKLDEKILE